MSIAGWLSTPRRLPLQKQQTVEVRSVKAFATTTMRPHRERERERGSKVCKAQALGGKQYVK